MNVAVLLLLAWQAAGSDPVADGVKALDARDFPAAIRLLSQAVEKDPQDYYAEFNLALAYSASNQDAQAIECYRKTLAVKPKLYEAELNLAILLIQTKKADEAIALLEDAQAQKPKEFRPAYHLGEAYLAIGKFDRAEAAFSFAIDHDPKSAPAELGMGRAIAEQGRVDDAAAHYRKAADLDPKYRDALVNLALTYEQRKQLPQAIEIYRQFPQSPAAQERLGALLLDQNKPEEAIAPLEFAVSKAPNTGNQTALVQAYLRAKHEDKALPFVNQLIAANPRELEFYMVRGRIYRDRRNFKEAANSFYAATRLKPDSVEAWNEFATMLISLEDYPAAISALDKIREMKAEKPGHFFLRAIILDKLKQPKPALAAYQQFLELAQGKYPDQEFQARQRVRIIERELSKR
jgi:tetratricopeptide (TPR) repeat protein